jgi:hypothetical protein
MIELLRWQMMLIEKYVELEVAEAILIKSHDKLKASYS